MSEQEFDYTEDDLILVVLIALNGYMEENHKHFSVDKDVLANIYENAAEKGLRPVLGLTHTEDNRLQIDVTMEDIE